MMRRRSDTQAASRFLFAGVLIAVSSLVSIEVRSASSEKADTSMVMPAPQLQFYKSKEGLMFAKAWGDPANGPHSNYIKLDGDTASPLHTHSASYYGVVISGVVANEPTAASKERPLPAGSYWYQKGGEPHVTKCISQEPCLIFVTSQQAFDFQIVP